MLAHSEICFHSALPECSSPRIVSPATVGSPNTIPGQQGCWDSENQSLHQGLHARTWKLNMICNPYLQTHASRVCGCHDLTWMPGIYMCCHLGCLFFFVDWAQLLAWMIIPASQNNAILRICWWPLPYILTPYSQTVHLQKEFSASK